MGQSYGEKNPCIQEHKRSGNAAGDIREGHQRKMKGDNIIQKKKKKVELPIVSLKFENSVCKK